MSSMSPTRLLRIDDLATDLSYSIRTIRRWILAKKLPKPKRCADGSYRWLQADILLWIELDMPPQADFENLKRSKHQLAS